MRRLLSILLFIFVIVNVSAMCNETQIDINSASAEKLDNLTGIGKVYAERIIENRPFDSLDDLLDVEGIGEKTLEKIKLQGLACVSNEETEKKEENNSSEKDIVKEKEENFSELVQKTRNTKQNLTPIILNSKDIKSENDKSNLGKNLAFGGIVIFCFAFGTLFFVKNRKRKNEFN